MTHRMRKAWLGVACAIVVGFVSRTASADPVQYQCLDNQLLRVRLDLVAQDGRGLTQRSHHHRHIPLEALLTCFGVLHREGTA